MPVTTSVPQYITVHLGEPGDDAPNLRVRFSRYIKNIAAGSVYPTWPENAIVANILALVSHTLNRVFTENYRGKGYDFDIANTSADEPQYIDGKASYNVINRIVDTVFNDYIVQSGSSLPYYSRYCTGTGGDCEELTSWQTVDLAEAGYTPYRILQYLYGSDIGVVRNAPVVSDTGPGIEAYKGVPLSLGSWGNDVNMFQRELNRIGVNYPAIPKIPLGSSVYDGVTKSAVTEFQNIFDIQPTGDINKATWYKIQFIYNALRAADRRGSSGPALVDIVKPFQEEYRFGDSGDFVEALQIYLNFISVFDNRVPRVRETGNFDKQTENAVLAFQQAYNLPATGVVDTAAANKLQEVYRSIYKAFSVVLNESRLQVYPGYFVTTGSPEPIVRQVQTWLAAIAGSGFPIPKADVTGVYDEKTRAAVLAFQQREEILQTGYVGPITWSALVSRYRSLSEYAPPTQRK